MSSALPAISHRCARHARHGRLDGAHGTTESHSWWLHREPQSAQPRLAIDLTLVDATVKPLDTGTPFDTFSPVAHTANASGIALENRHRLQRLMEAEGFVNYDQEWWHYTFDVPYPVRFDRVIR